VGFSELIGEIFFEFRQLVEKIWLNEHKRIFTGDKSREKDFDDHDR
jgi:hypothetical protein